MLGKKLIQAAAVKAGAAGGLGIEELFQTWLYTGNGSTQTITNGIDLAGEGGLVWAKSRNIPQSHGLFDTIRGGTGRLFSNTTAADDGTGNLSFSSSGFSLTNGNGVTNSAGDTYTSWTFRKAPGFFDVVTYTGNGTTQNIAHNLGSVPGTIIVKRTDSTGNWLVYHRSLSTIHNYLLLNSPGTVGGSSAVSPWPWGATAPTNGQFSVGFNSGVNAEFQTNANGASYVAYLFAHDEQIFGEGGDQSVIKCGSIATDASGKASINLGWEPQWILFKSSDFAVDWYIWDTMRGIVTGGADAVLQPNNSGAEFTADNATLTPIGFDLSATVSKNWVYVAIRRGPMKTPTSGTEVFDADAQTGGSFVTTGFPVDLCVSRGRSTFNNEWRSRLTGPQKYLWSDSTAAEASNTPPAGVLFDKMNGVEDDTFGTISAVYWNFRRAPGFFDVVAYTGTGAARTVAHNLGTAPELMIIKGRSVGQDWVVYSASEGASKAGYLNTTAAFFSDSGNAWNNTSPTASVFTVNVYSSLNGIGNTYIAYLFATCPGVSKVFSFTGNGTSQTIDCGFAAGARFVLLKRTDSAGNWLVADTARGIISGNDPLLYLNSAAAEITTLDWIDPHSSGFIVNQEATANANVGGATYIGLAIA